MCETWSTSTCQRYRNRATLPTSLQIGFVFFDDLKGSLFTLGLALKRTQVGGVGYWTAFGDDAAHKP
jgi:hypothetical protein